MGVAREEGKRRRWRYIAVSLHFKQTVAVAWDGNCLVQFQGRTVAELGRAHHYITDIAVALELFELRQNQIELVSEVIALPRLDRADLTHYIGTKCSRCFWAARGRASNKYSCRMLKETRVAEVFLDEEETELLAQSSVEER